MRFVLVPIALSACLWAASAEAESALTKRTMTLRSAGTQSAERYSPAIASVIRDLDAQHRNQRIERSPGYSFARTPA